MRNDEPVSLSCDLCGLMIDRNFSNWNKGHFEVAETKVSITIGESYPEY
jgi:hypothetical protein